MLALIIMDLYIKEIFVSYLIKILTDFCHTPLTSFDIPYPIAMISDISIGKNLII